MAEQVNHRIEEMINELEQMQRTNLYTPDEIREISRKRKDFEYKIQRQTKQKEDYVNYIAYEMALLEDISLRRKCKEISEKKKDIEYSIAKRVNKLFKQFIYRFQNDVEVYFQYIKFCLSVGFNYAVSGIIGQMLQMYGDKPKMWQLAGKWEHQEGNLEKARGFYLKGIHRHPNSEVLYLDLFKIELILAFQAENDEERETQIKRANIVWRSGMKNIKDVNFLFQIFDLSMKCEFTDDIIKELKEEIWSLHHEMKVWSFIAAKELEGCHWEQIEEFVDENGDLPEKLNNFVAVYEEALQKFPDIKLCMKLISELLNVKENICTLSQRLKATKRVWLFGHERGLLSFDDYRFGIDLFDIENDLPKEKYEEILNSACEKYPTAVYIWRQKIAQCGLDEEKLYSILKEANKVLDHDKLIILLNDMLDSISSSAMVKKLCKNFNNGESTIFLGIRPKLLEKTFEYCGLKAARDLYEEFIRTPPLQLDVHTIMIKVEESQNKPSYKHLKKCYEYMIQHHGTSHYEIWLNYIKFETENHNAKSVPNIYRRAVAMLKKDMVDEFIKAHALSKLK